MAVHPLAGKPAPPGILVSVPRLVSAFYTREPDPGVAGERVSFGTSGHRGSSFCGSFNEHHVLAIAQAICDVRRSRGIDGPVYLGMDTHALSEPAHAAALEVFAGNGADVMIQAGLTPTPTPVVSHAILAYNQGLERGHADGVVMTPSHNPPEDGGVKYNPPTGGPADKETTLAIEERANELLESGLGEVRRIPYERALRADTTHEYDYVEGYVKDLWNAIDLQAIATSGLSIGADPLGGSGLAYFDAIAEEYGVPIEVVNRDLDPRFAFMSVDKDGRIRMDCSSRFAMAGLIAIKDRFDIAFGNDPDFDRHGIVTRSGLLDPNAYLAVCVQYLFERRDAWRRDALVGKTLVSSSMIDRVAAALGRELCEVPVGFKWFVPGLLDGSLGFGGEESAGASFLRRDGSTWTTDKDGILLDLLAAEMTAVTGKDPAARYAALEERFGRPAYERIDAPATAKEREALASLDPSSVEAGELAGDPIVRTLTRAPGNDEPIGGLKIVTEHGWFAARPSGTEEIYKIYAESFRGEKHLRQIQKEAKTIVSRAFDEAGIA